MKILYLSATKKDYSVIVNLHDQGNELFVVCDLKYGLGEDDISILLNFPPIGITNCNFDDIKFEKFDCIIDKNNILRSSEINYMTLPTSQYIDESYIINIINKSTEKFSFQDYIKLTSIKTPILFISDLGDSFDKYYIANKLKIQLERLDVNPIIITDLRESAILKSYIYPDIFFDWRSPVDFRLSYLTSWINWIENKENPDLIILTIPGNYSEVSDELIGDLGVYNYLLSYSLSCDFSVLCSSYILEVENDNFEKFNRSRFGYAIDFHIKNNVSLLNDEPVFDSSNRDCFRVSHDYIIEFEKESDCNKNFVYVNKTYEKLAKSVVNKLKVD
ncbi:hypothetical protein [Erysipelothrix rhusiopathiae]|uniref:hypothetical protein n=1 Tax=Erysipelothrix rhusiopathiae TaxID=1648 RepID=UPI000789C7D5|nr:hypothetical protein [Erysipelothrix rhusiopathiae]AMS11309.1 hypothetical protein A2I91_06030 [Erysipelothrix rhusiopathiae]